MEAEMPRLTEQVHSFLRDHIQPGDMAVDATMGNGHDTVFLAEQVGPAGRVLAFDVQEEACLSTRRRLNAAKLSNVDIVLDCHSRIESHIPQVAAIVSTAVFNLGYLPGAEKSVTTQPATTTSAIEAAWRVLRERGVISVLAYIGHDGGVEESLAVEAVLDRQPRREWLRRDSLNPDTLSPRFFLIRKQPPA